MLKKSFLFLMAFFTFVCHSQNQKLSQNTKVSIFTCDRGQELYSTFGHTALRIQDPIHNLDVVYNYGCFDFRTENFYLKFVKGDLQYYMNATSYDEFIFEYKLDQRKVIEQTLDLPLEKKQELFDALNKSLFSEQRYYTYKFIDRNCTTMVTEKINALFGQQKIRKVDPVTLSYRSLLYPYFENYFWYKLGINIVFGAKTDGNAVQLFLPIELEHSLDKAVVDGKPLVTKKEIVVQGNNFEPKHTVINSIYFVCFILLILIVLNNKYIMLSYLFISGLLGLLFCMIGLYSEHQEVLWNYNALLFNPLLVLLPFLKEDFRKKVNVIILVMLLLYSIVMVTKPHIVLMIPFIITQLYFLIKLNGKNPLKLLSSVK